MRFGSGEQGAVRCASGTSIPISRSAAAHVGQFVGEEGQVVHPRRVGMPFQYVFCSKFFSKPVWT